MKKFIVVTIAALALAGISQGTAYCSACQRVDCSFDLDCGVRCDCVKLNGKIRGQCVEKW